MRALSIRQPWAWLIVNGHKDVENRDWPTDWRGEFLVHAGKSTAELDVAIAQVRDVFPSIALPTQYELGGVIGVATLTGCFTELESPWFSGPYGFALAHARPLPFMTWRGQLGWFDVPLTARLQAALHAPTPAQAEAAGQERLLP